MGCALSFSPGWEVDSAGGTAGLCQPVERDIYDCYVTCFWPAQVPDHLNNYPGLGEQVRRPPPKIGAISIWYSHRLHCTGNLRTHYSASLLRSPAGLQAATLFMGAYPNSVLVFDEAQGKVVDRIPLTTGLAHQPAPLARQEKIFVTTNDHSGIEVIDAATRKVINHFVLNTATKRYRFNGGTPDPTGKLLLHHDHRDR